MEESTFPDSALSRESTIALATSGVCKYTPRPTGRLNSSSEVQLRLLLTTGMPSHFWPLEISHSCFWAWICCCWIIQHLSCICTILRTRNFYKYLIKFDLKVPLSEPARLVTEPIASPLSPHSPPWTPTSFTKSHPFSEPSSLPLNVRFLSFTSSPSLSPHPGFSPQGSGEWEAFFHCTLSNSEKFFLLLFQTTPSWQWLSLRTQSLSAGPP